MSLLDCEFYSEKRGAEYELMLSAWGEGVLAESALLDIQKPDAIFKKFMAKYRRYPKSISLTVEDPRAVGYDFGYTGIDSALLEKLLTLKELVLPDSVTEIGVTPGLKKIFEENGTLIRGSFGSFAESFARGQGLRFRPADRVIAEYFFAPAQESTRLTLEFSRTGNALIREDVSSPGTSASNTFGGSFFHPLKKDFFMTDTAEQIAALFGERLRGALIADGRLADFIEKAKTHCFYKGEV